jgi:catalase
MPNDEIAKQKTGPGPAEGVDAREPAERYRLPAPGDAGALMRMAVIGGVVMSVAAGFAFAGGWLSPRRLTQGRMIAAFAAANGTHAGFRYNHAKGVCVAGYFDSNGNAAALSKAVVFQPGRTPVFGRFALAGGHPEMADGPKAVRSMALDFSLRDGEMWRTGMNDIPVFAVRTPQGFYDQLLALQPDPRTGRPNPARMRAFLADHPETARAKSIIARTPFSSGFANSTFNSLDAFRFIDSKGRSHAVRWSMAPADPFAAADPVGAQNQDPNYLFDDLRDRLRRGPVRWRLVVTVAAPGDPTDDATLPWPENREHLDAGILTLNSISDEDHGRCRDINFDPLILPAGIAPSDDPLLSARSAAYSRSFTLREGQRKPPSAVQIQSPAKGV